MLAIVTLLLLVLLVLLRRPHGARARRRRRLLILDGRRTKRFLQFRVAHRRQIPGRRVLHARLRRAESAPHGVGGAGGEAGDALEDAVGFLLGGAGFF
jgi:hypothetical protein